MKALREPAEQLISEVMTNGMVTIGRDGTVGRARELMLGLGIHCLPVVDGADSVIGFVTSTDLVEEWPFGEPVSTIMSHRVYTVRASDSVAVGARRMLTEGVHHLLVLDSGEPAGVVSSFDMLEALVDLGDTS